MICYEINHNAKKDTPKDQGGTYFGLAYCMTYDEVHKLHQDHHLVTMVNMWDYGNFLIDSYGKKEPIDI